MADYQDRGIIRSPVRASNLPEKVRWRSSLIAFEMTIGASEGGTGMRYVAQHIKSAGLAFGALAITGSAALAQDAARAASRHHALPRIDCRNRDLLHSQA